MTLSSAVARTIIERKADGMPNSPEEIDALVDGYVAGDIDDGVMAAWLMAVRLRGMSPEETADLTGAMARSGDTIDWTDLVEPVVDKHSTGGVGDATTLVAVPVAAACGIKVAKLSGRALGFTGGTIDKLECVPGLRTELGIDEFKAQVERIGCAIASSTSRLAPADKKMYALRDRTATIASRPLIAASILSKKIAGGAPAIVFDVKVGAGAFMRSIEEARGLAHLLIDVGTILGRRIRVLLTAMDEPLADAIGDALELDEALRVLEGPAPSRLREVGLVIAQAMLEVGGRTGPAPAVKLDDRSALRMFEAMVAAQGGNLRKFDRDFGSSAEVSAQQRGRVTAVDARVLGEAIAAAKSGQPPKTAQRIGMRLVAHVGDDVNKGQTLARIYAPKGSRVDAAEVASAFILGAGDEPSADRALILGTLGA